MLDFLSDILSRLSLKGTLYFRTSFVEPFGVKVPAFENVARFHFAYKGDCLVFVDGREEPVHLSQGDLILVPHGVKHTITCRITPPEDAVKLDDVLERSGYDGNGFLVYGGEQPAHDTQLICGHFSIAPGSRHILFDYLPSYIHIRQYGAQSGGWLEATLRVIGSEAASDRIGADLIAQKMSEVIFAQAIRSHVEFTADGSDRLSGFADRNLVRALSAFHRDPMAEWTVEGLAREAALSRTSFASRFSTKLGTTPFQYMTAWRLQLARDALSKRKLTVAEAAEIAGYASEAAFSRVFKREFGLAPAAFKNSEMAQASLTH